MKYQDTRIYLLDFQRSANQVFDGTLPVYEDDGIILGVRDKNVEYMMNDAATVIAFVQEGDLWSYSPGNEKVNQVFSFRKLKDGDFRDSRTQHDITIVMVNCNSFISFMASSVHISIKYEINISFISYSDNLDVMLSSGISADFAE